MAFYLTNAFVVPYLKIDPLKQIRTVISKKDKLSAELYIIVLIHSSIGSCSLSRYAVKNVRFILLCQHNDCIILVVLFQII